MLLLEAGPFVTHSKKIKNWNISLH